MSTETKYETKHENKYRNALIELRKTLLQYCWLIEVEGQARVAENCDAGIYTAKDAKEYRKEADNAKEEVAKTLDECLMNYNSLVGSEDELELRGQHEHMMDIFNDI
jgi:hypothetical protein